MRYSLFALLIILAAAFSNCNSGKGNTSFCDTSCMKDSLKLSGGGEFEPYVHFSVKNCSIDTIIWSYKGLGSNRKMKFEGEARLNKDFVKAYFHDTSYVYLKFNDCNTGRGYLVKLPFDKKQDISSKSSALNSFDPKFSVADGLIAYTDRGNIYVEDESTGQQAMMTFGKKAEIEYNAIHQTLDSINVTRNHVWVKVKLDGEWKVLEKNISLK
jgi:hypothetical protein